MEEAVEITKGMTYTLMFDDGEYCIILLGFYYHFILFFGLSITSWIRYKHQRGHHRKQCHRTRQCALLVQRRESRDYGLIVEPASLIHDRKNESCDTIHFSYDKFISNVNTDSKNDNSATITGNVLGSLGFILGVGIIILGNNQRRFRNRSLNQNEDDLSLNTMPTDISIFSRSSISRNNGNNGSRSSHSSSNSNTTENNESNNDAQLVHI